MTLDNYSQVETVNLKVLSFIVTSDTILIEHKIFDLEKKTIKISISKLWPVYYVPSIQICLLFTKQII